MSDETLATEVLGAGPHPGRPLLVLHGAAGSPHDNYPFLDRLAQTRTVLAPSLPGVGDSPLGDAPLRVADVAERVLRAVEATGHERVDVCGYSMGTLVAARLAALAPDRVASLTLVAGLARAHWSCQDVMQRWAHLLDGPADALGRFIVDRVYRAETVRARGQQWYELAVADAGQAPPPGTRDHIDLICHADVRADLAATRQPMLVVVADRDEFVTPDHSEEIVRLRPDARVVRVDAGHAVGDEAPEEWYAALTEFLDSLAS